MTTGGRTSGRVKSASTRSLPANSWRAMKRATSVPQTTTMESAASATRIDRNTGSQSNTQRSAGAGAKPWRANSAAASGPERKSRYSRAAVPSRPATSAAG